MLVSTPRRTAAGTAFFPDFWTDEFLLDYENWLQKRSAFGVEAPSPPAADVNGPPMTIGELTYRAGGSTSLTVPPSVGPSFKIHIPNYVPQKGLHIPSHRPIFSYQSVENIPTVPRRRDQVFGVYTDIVRARHYGGYHQRTPNYYMKETLIALAAFGYGNQVIDRDDDSLETFDGFERILATILPPSIGFIRLAVRLPEVVLVTRSGDFSLDAVSGGIASLVDLAWQVFMYASPATPFAVTIDEPENHLHPELQRTVLSTFLAAFPHVQFICATHNPFVVTSVAESSTYALRYGDDHKVRSELLSYVDRTGSANEILRDVLGLPSSSPVWVEQILREITAVLADRELTVETVAELRKQLQDSGLEKFLPSALAKLASDQLSE